jgi:hypothetical protein
MVGDRPQIPRDLMRRGSISKELSCSHFVTSKARS